MPLFTIQFLLVAIQQNHLENEKPPILAVPKLIIGEGRNFNQPKTPQLLTFNFQLSTMCSHIFLLSHPTCHLPLVT